MSQTRDTDEFKLISYKRKSSKKQAKPAQESPIALQDCETPEEIDKVIRRINSAKEEFLVSNVFLSLKALLNEGLLLLENPKIIEIICFGLGHVNQITSRYQLCFLLYLKERFNVTVYAYDPLFNEQDKLALKEFELNILDENCEGKYLLKERGATICYMPHCPLQLSNNLLWKNWGLQLTNCVLIANSFHQVILNRTNTFLRDNAQFVAKIFPHTTELSVINEFKFYEVFNDTSIHVFPLKKLCFLPKDFWEDCSEPEYKRDDTEYITKDIELRLKIH